MGIYWIVDRQEDCPGCGRELTFDSRDGFDGYEPFGYDLVPVEVAPCHDALCVCGVSVEYENGQRTVVGESHWWSDRPINRLGIPVDGVPRKLIWP